MWLRLEVDSVDDPKFFEMAGELGCTAGDAFRCAVRIWGRLAVHRPDGNLAAIPDELLNDWAGWAAVPRGTGAEFPADNPADFARTFRKLFQLEDGFLDLWRELQGPLLRRQESDRQRKRAAREAPRAASAEVPADTPADAPPERRVRGARNEYENELTATTQSSGGAALEASALQRWPHLAAWHAGSRHAELLDEYRAAVLAARGLWEGTASILEMAMTAGFGRAVFAPEELDRALLDLKTAGWPASGRALRTFLEGQRPIVGAGARRDRRVQGADLNGTRGTGAPLAAGRLGAATFRAAQAAANAPPAGPAAPVPPAAPDNAAAHPKPEDRS